LISSTKGIKLLKNMIMDSSKLSGFVGILRETTKIFSKNGKLMISLTLLFLSLFSISYLSLVFSANPFLVDLVKKASLVPITIPRSPEYAELLIDLKNDIRSFAAIEWIFVIIATALSLYFVTATIIASALTHGGKSLSCKELLLSAAKSLKRPFFTWFYVTLLGLGFVFFFLATLLPLVLIVQQPVAVKALAIIFAILATVLYSYLAIIWILAFVISALEEKCGIEALGKAAQLVKGMQLQGFALNLLFTVSSFLILLVTRLTIIKQSFALTTIMGLVLLICSCLLTMFRWAAYTVFYYQCKKIHGEQVELQGSIVYSIIPTSPLLDESIP
ncbi:Polyadenylate-binding protein 1-B-binding protein, partial [Melia azedarach]